MGINRQTITLQKLAKEKGGCEKEKQIIQHFVT